MCYLKNVLHPGVDFITVLRLICTLRATFEKLFKGVERALRRAPNFDRAISMFRPLRPTFMKSTPDVLHPGILHQVLIAKTARKSAMTTNKFFSSKITTDIY